MALGRQYPISLAANKGSEPLHHLGAFVRIRGGGGRVGIVAERMPGDFLRIAWLGPWRLHDILPEDIIESAIGDPRK